MRFFVGSIRAFAWRVESAWLMLVQAIRGLWHVCAEGLAIRQVA